MRALVIAAALTLGACAVSPEQQARSQVEWSRIQAEREARNPTSRPTRTIAWMTPEQVRDQIVVRCATGGFNVASSDPSHIICDRDAGVLAGALLTQGYGPQPRLQFHVVTAMVSNGVVVVGWQQLQTYTWTGAPGMNESGMNRTQRAEVERVLADLHPVSSQVQPSGPNQTPTH